MFLVLSVRPFCFSESKQHTRYAPVISAPDRFTLLVPITIHFHGHTVYYISCNVLIPVNELMNKKRKMTVDEYREMLAEVEKFLVETIELTEKIQSAIETGGYDIKELYVKRKTLFDSASGFLLAWIKHVHLNASDSWDLYRQFLRVAEDEHVKKQHEVLNDPNPTNLDNPLSVTNSAFVVQEDSEIKDKQRIDALIEMHALSHSELHEILSNLSLQEITKLLNLSKDITGGNIWERKYDL